jgi:hypothetical protein
VTICDKGGKGGSEIAKFCAPYFKLWTAPYLLKKKPKKNKNYAQL